MFGSVIPYGIMAMISYPLMIEEISKRVGKAYISVGTGMVFFLSQALTSILIYMLGFIMNSGTKISSLYVLLVGAGSVCFVFMMSIVADCSEKTDKYGASKEMSKSESDKYENMSLAAITEKIMEDGSMSGGINEDDDDFIG